MMTLMSQGSGFYAKLTEFLNKLLQNAQDFVMTRNIEKGELIQNFG
jgi:hypothetical protein